MDSRKFLPILLPILIFLCLTWITEAGIVRTERPLRCHICDSETCKKFNKKAEPQNCTADQLISEDQGPDKLYELSSIRYVPLDNPTPIFGCQKIEGYDRYGNLNVVRRCQIRMPGNESCSVFYRKANDDPEKTYRNVTCLNCETDGCNSSESLFVWISLLLGSSILSTLV